MDSLELRRRAGGGQLPGVRASTSFSAPPDGDSSKRRSAAARPYGWPLVLLLAASFAAVYRAVYQLELQLPPPGALERNARSYLHQLVRLGPKPCGSPANDVQAVQVILGSLEAMKKGVKSQLYLEVDHQVVSGSFKVERAENVTSAYAQVQNVVAKLGPASGSDHSVLVNCHFDSAIGSPGASDDGVSCAVMLEVLRRISQSHVQLRHNIIFLFNGAEENMLQAAHGFITQHRWAWSVRAHLNLEACGAGGREMVFQTGPGHPWLVKAYAEAAPHPFAHTIGQEIFQSGIIPSDTDFRIFRDYGGIPGLDTAFVRNGYVYHTEFDNEAQITPGSVQRAGENVEAILLRLATADDIVNAHTQEVGTNVFMDIFGLFMLVVPEWLYQVISYSAAVVTALSIAHSVRIRGFSWMQLALSCGVQLLSWTLAAAVAMVIAVLLDFFDSSMSWYASHGWAVGLYAAPCLGAVLLVQQGLADGLLSSKGLQDGWRLESLQYESQRLLLLLPVICLTCLRVYSSVLLLAMLLVPTVLRSLLTETLLGIRSGAVHLLVYTVSQLLPVAMVMVLTVITTELFIPIMGRAGNATNPELLVAGLVSGCTVFSTLFLVTSLSLLRPVRLLARLLLLVGLVSLGLVLLTPAGFPFNADRPHPRSQRVWIQHIERTFRDERGAARRPADAGFLFLNGNRRSPGTLLSAVPELRTANRTAPECDTELFCGIPYIFPVRTRVYDNHYVPGPAPVFSAPVNCRTRTEDRPDGLRRVHFNITGPDHLTLQLSPRPGVDLVTWSLADGVPMKHGSLFQGRPTYFLYYSWGKQPTPWTLWMDLKVYDGVRQPSDYLLDAAVSGLYLHGPGTSSAPQLALLARLPSWTTPVTVQASYSALRV